MLKYEIGFKRGNYSEPDSAYIHNSQIPDQVANFAMQLICTPGVLTIGKHDGEDSAGRAKAAPYSPQEVAERAFDIAMATFQEMEKRGLLVDLPGIEETREKAREADSRN